MLSICLRNGIRLWTILYHVDATITNTQSSMEIAVRSPQSEHQIVSDSLPDHHHTGSVSHSPWFNVPAHFPSNSNHHSITRYHRNGAETLLAIKPWRGRFIWLSESKFWLKQSNLNLCTTWRFKNPHTILHVSTCYKRTVQRWMQWDRMRCNAMRCDIQCTRNGREWADSEQEIECCWYNDWSVIGDFCCSVSGLTHLSFSLSTRLPRGC